MRKITNLIVFCVIYLPLIAQDSSLSFHSNRYNECKSLIDKFESYVFSIPVEKVYLHIDKPFYFADEDIWFKAYLVDGTFHKMRSVSNVLYVELLNSENELIKRHTLKITDGYAIGDFELDKNIPQGKYMVRAYTNGMRNFDECFVFHKYFDIFNSSISNQDDSVKSYDNLSDNIDLQFFPEGGYLIEGLPSQLAFKAIDNNGKSVNVEGAIYDQNDNIISTFKTSHLGIGKISFTPEQNSNYYAKITSLNNKIKYKIPDPLNKGYVLSVNSTRENNIMVEVRTSTPGSSVCIIGQSGGKIYYASELNMDQSLKKILIPKFTFPSGIVQFTLFDEYRKPFSERLVFVKNNEDILNISLNTNKNNYSKREKVSLKIKATDLFGTPQKSNFSVSVTDVYQTQSGDSLNDNIFSYILLTSELKGHIEAPAYYFRDDNPTRLEHLDNLLLTQGWRRFSWQEALENEKITCNYAFEKGIVLNGKITQCPRRYPVEENKLVTMFLTENSHSQIITPQIDSTFELELPHYTGKKTVIFQSLNKSNNKIKLNIDIDSARTDLELPHINLDFNTTLNLSESQKNIISEKKFVDNFYSDDSTEFIDEVVIVQKRIEPVEKPNTYRLLPEGGIYFEKFPHRYSDNVIDYFRQFPGVQILKDKENINTIIRFGKYKNTSFLLSTEPLYIIDDIPFTEIDAIRFIETLKPEEIKYINALSGPETAFYGARGSCGVIVIYTKIPITTEKWNNTGYQYFNLNGFYYNREFYSPNYAVAGKEHEKRDLRATLYWNPNIQTNEDGEAKLNFFNTDRTTRIKIQIEGISNNGYPGVKEIYYDIN